MVFFYLNYHIKPNDVFITDINGMPSEWGDYYEGQPVARAKKPPLFIYDKGKMVKQDWLQGIQSIPVISSRLKALFETEEGVEAEYHPVTLRCEETRMEDKDYFFMNVLGNIKCINPSASEVSYFTPDSDVITDIDKLVLDTTRIGKRTLFRVDEFPTLLLFGESLKDKISMAGMTGMDWDDAKDYNTALTF